MPFRRNAHIMYAVSFLQGMLFYASVSTLYRQTCGITVFQITLIESVSMVLAIFYIADTFWMFLLKRVVLSVVYSGLSGVDTSIFFLSCGDENAQKVIGRNNALNSAGLLLASAVFACLPDGSYRLAAWLSLFTYGAAAVLTLFLVEVRHAPDERVNPFRSLRQSLANLCAMPGLIPLLIMSVLFFEVVLNITGFFRSAAVRTRRRFHQRHKHRAYHRLHL